MAITAINWHPQSPGKNPTFPEEFDKKYNPTWHCVVGRNFGSYVTHETKHFIYFYLGQAGPVKGEFDQVKTLREMDWVPHFSWDASIFFRMIFRCHEFWVPFE